MIKIFPTTRSGLRLGEDLFFSMIFWLLGILLSWWCPTFVRPGQQRCVFIFTAEIPSNFWEVKTIFPRLFHTQVFGSYRMWNATLGYIIFMNLPIMGYFSTNQYYCYSTTTNPRMVQISGTGANPVGLAAHLFKRSQSFRKQSKPRNPRLFVNDQGNVWTYESIASLKLRKCFVFESRLNGNLFTPQNIGLPRILQMVSGCFGWRCGWIFTGPFGADRLNPCFETSSLWWLGEKESEALPVKFSKVFVSIFDSEDMETLMSFFRWWQLIDEHLHPYLVKIDSRFD